MSIFFIRHGESEANVKKYFAGQKIIKLSEYANNVSQSSNALHNSARRQTIPAFREKGIWKIGV